MNRITLLVLCCCMCQSMIQGARILAVIPTHSYSHQLYYRPIIIELAKQGHEIVYVTTMPINDPTIKNLTEIDIGNLCTALNSMNFLPERWKTSWIDSYDDVWNSVAYRSIEQILAHPPIKNMYEHETRQKFDLLIVEFMWYHALYGLAHVFNCPVVGVVSLSNFITMKDVLGLPQMPSHPSNWEFGNRTGNHLSFFRRLENYITYLNYLYKYRYEFLPKQNVVAKKFFGENFPDIEKIVKNTSLVLMSHNVVLEHPVPVIGKVVPISGIHLFTNFSKDIPPNLEQFMNDAEEGFVYVSLGSNIQSKNLPVHLREIFLEVFSNLPYRILWKYEDDTLPPLPSKFYISKWMPQQLILSHPNIKVFIYQGGHQSTEEAVSSGVPMVGLAAFADQDCNLARLAQFGIIKNLEISTITKTDFDKAIREVITDKSFKDNALKAQKVFFDKPNDSLQQAVWWIEYVIRNNGTPFHYYSLADDPWYSRYDEDVIAVLSITLFIITCAVIMGLIKLLKFCRRLINNHYKLNKKEKNN